MRKLKESLIISISLIIFIGCAGMHYGRGVSYLEQEKYPEAINAFKTVLEQNQEYSNTNTQIGIAYYKTGMYEQAISELKAAKGTSE